MDGNEAHDLSFSVNDGGRVEERGGNITIGHCPLQGCCQKVRPSGKRTTREEEIDKNNQHFALFSYRS